MPPPTGQGWSWPIPRLLEIAYVTALLSVIGVDDHEMAQSHELTTIAQPVPEQGRLATNILIDEVEGVTARGAAPAHVIPSTLLLRRTTALPATQSPELAQAAG